MTMKNPVHPGAIVREDCLKPLGLSVTEGAKRLGVGRQTLSNLVNERASVSIEMAYRLSKAFGSTPETWLGMQLALRPRAVAPPRADDTDRASRSHVAQLVRQRVRQRRIVGGHDLLGDRDPVRHYF